MTSNCAVLPASATAGLTFQAAVALAAFPAPDWTLRAFLRGPAVIDLTATANGTSHEFNATATATGAWAPGDYWFSLRASKGADVVEVSKGALVVHPDMTQATAGFDGRSDNQKALDAIVAVLGKRATLDQERYRINNRELYRTSIADLLKLRAHYVTAVRRENAKSRGCSTFGRPIRVRFS